MEDSTEVGIFFYSHRGCDGWMSNFYPSRFEYDGISMHWSEQALMYTKAKSMNDQTSMKAIAAATTPAQCKQLGRRVNPYDETKWASERYDVMVEVLRCKFGSNPDLSSKLIETSDAILIEAAPSDKIWGVGMSKQAAQVLPLPKVLEGGLNLLGNALMQVRSEIAGE